MLSEQSEERWVADLTADMGAWLLSGESYSLMEIAGKALDLWNEAAKLLIWLTWLKFQSLSSVCELLSALVCTWSHLCR